MTDIATPSATTSHRPRTGWAWLVILVPFVITVIVGGPASGRLLPHGTYHLAYVAVIAAAIGVLLRWRAASTSTSVRRLTMGLAALQGLGIIGHVGEWVSTLRDGQFLDGTTVVDGDEDLHTLFANITVPALVLSIVGLIALSVVMLRRPTPGHVAGTR